MNLPPNIYQNLPWMQNQQGGAAGNSKWSQTNPFRTVDEAGQYGSGTNASAGQLYNHFRSGGREAMDYGLKPAGAVQGMQEFLDRNKPAQDDSIWGNHTQAYKDRVAELMSNRGWTQRYSMGNQNHALGVNADFGGDGAVSNNEWARHLGADYDNDGNVTGKEWTQYGGQSPSRGFPVRPGNIPNMGPGIFNLQPPAAQGGGLNPGMPSQPMPPQRPSPQTNPQGMQPGIPPMPFGGMPQQPRGTPGQWVSPQQGPAPMPNQQMPQAPQVPQFNPSIFNIGQQPAMVNRPMPQGVR